MTGASFIAGLSALIVAGWWLHKRAQHRVETELRHLEDAAKAWGDTSPRAKRRQHSPQPSQVERRPTTIRQYCDADQRRITQWQDGMAAQLEEIRNLPETQIEEWLR